MQITRGNAESFKIRKARKADMKAVLGLINDLAVFEKAPNALIVTENDLVKDGFGKSPLFNVFIAEVKKEVVGMALIYTGYSTWKGKLIYLDDLIVKEEYRNRGIGKLLLDKVIEYATKRKARVLKWQVLRWNKDAIRFYNKYDSVVYDDEWVDCKMYEKDFKVNQRIYETIHPPGKIDSSYRSE